MNISVIADRYPHSPAIQHPHIAANEHASAVANQHPTTSAFRQQWADRLHLQIGTATAVASKTVTLDHRTRARVCCTATTWHGQIAVYGSAILIKVTGAALLHRSPGLGLV